jgi:aminodeoxyfutalosine deaminase
LVGISEGKIAFLGRGKAPVDGKAIDLGQGVILPALVNAHSHLELSALEGCIEPGLGFLPWVKKVLALRGSIGDRESIEAFQRALNGLHEMGTIAVGDWCTSFPAANLEPPGKIVRCGFYEIIGFSEQTLVIPESMNSRTELRTPNSGLAFQSLGAHAPHTTSAALLQSAKSWTLGRDLPLSIHLAESLEEEEFLLTGQGLWQELLKDRGRWPNHWTPPEVSPVAYLDRLGLVDEKTQCIHLTRAGHQDLEILKMRQARIVVCPRSNTYITGALPPLPKMVRLGLAPALGTDSLASNQDLNLWEEMAFVHRSFPSLAPETILEMATLNGAKSLDLENWGGSIALGKKAPLLFLPLEMGSSRELPAAIIDSRGKNLRWIAEKGFEDSRGRGFK